MALRRVPGLALTLFVVFSTLALSLALGELVLRFLNTRLDGIVDHFGWAWGRIAVVVLWALALHDWFFSRWRRRR
jgi:hypothetical protein